MKKMFGALVFSLVALSGAVAAAHGYNHGDVTITHPWTKESAEGQKNAGIFMEITAKGTEKDALIRAETNAAEKVELHAHIHENGVMKMRAVEKMDIVPGEKLELKPGSYHVMLFNLKKPFVKGEEVPVTLYFEKAGKIEVVAKVEAHDFKGTHEHHAH